MTRSDFYKLVGIIVHLDYQKIPRYRLTWSPSLCYDPFLSEVMSHNHFESTCFLHVDKKSESIEERW